MPPSSRSAAISTHALTAGVAARSWGLVLGAALFFFVHDTHAKDEDREVSSVQLVRMVFGADAFRGSALVGVGSREPYLGYTLGGEMGVTALTSPHLGLDISLAFAALGNKDTSFNGRAEIGVFTVPLEKDGPGGHSILVGLGFGTEGGDRVFWADIRAYPYVFVRGTKLFDRKLGGAIDWRCAPIDTGLPSWAMENRLELSFGSGLFITGFRAALTTVVGGEPQRLYGDFTFGVFVGLNVRFEPIRRGP